MALVVNGFMSAVPVQAQGETVEPEVAPYVDIMDYVRVPDYAINGVPKLTKLSEESGIDHFNLGFILGYTTEDGEKTWSWGGYKGMNPIENDGWQFAGIHKSLKAFRDQGGTYSISFGGAKSGQQQIWQQTKDVDAIAAIYKDVITRYEAPRIDLDVEGEYMDYQENLRNAQAVKKVQDETDVEVTLTLPVMHTGLVKSGQQVLKAYLEEGVDLTYVNIMTMCYGSAVSDYGQGSIDAIDQTAKQLQTMYQTYAEKKMTSEAAYQKIGTTCCIGPREGHPYFTLKQFEQVVKHAREKKVGMISFWSMNKDALLTKDKEELLNAYDYAKIAIKEFETVPEKDTEAPTRPEALKISAITSTSAKASWQASKDNQAVDYYEVTTEGDGKRQTVETKECQQGFDHLTEQTTYDVSVTAVDTSGNRSKAATTTFVTLKAPETEKPDTSWQSNRVYVKGDVVQHEGIEYMAHWWTKGEAPSSSGEWGVWRPTTPKGSESGAAWEENRAYKKGDIVTYGGKQYQAHWWTKGVIPSSCGKWEVWRLVEN